MHTKNPVTGGGEKDNKVPKNIRIRANLAFNLRASTQVNVSVLSIIFESLCNVNLYICYLLMILMCKYDPLGFRTWEMGKQGSFCATSVHNQTHGRPFKLRTRSPYNHGTQEGFL